LRALKDCVNSPAMAAVHSESLARARAFPAAWLPACVVFALMGLNSVGSSHVDPWPAGARETFRVGQIDLRPCQSVQAYCGTLERPLDPTGTVPGRVSIYFEYYPHTGSGKSVGTLVATEGGPGYPATLSRDDYLALFEPLRTQRNVLLMDNRGTGRSGAIDCHGLQTAEKWTIELTAACGRSLGKRASLYSTAYAADDLAAVLQALGIRRIDLYGDSYGTYFEQVFAVRHPDVLRSLVLDGAYPLNGPDYAWYPTYAPAMRDKFNIACRRFAPCAAIPGDSISHILPLLNELRSHPFAARAPDSDGKERAFTADASQLAIVMFGSAPTFATARELDAAARAFAAGDRLPVLRLMAETISAVDSRDPTADATQWSAGLAAAVMCQDPPQIFDMRLEPARRRADRDRAIAERKRTLPLTYAPFTLDEYRGMPLDYSFIDQCVDWPVAPANHPASNVVAGNAKYPEVPALIISGELDNMTTTADGARVAAAFKLGRQIHIANSFHVNALPRARSDCAARIARRFLQTLKVGDTSCAAEVPALRLVPRFVRHVSQLDAAIPLDGNRADAEQLRWVSAAVMTVGDVLARLGGNSTGQGVGLRGGSFRVVNDASTTHVSLTGVRWTEDAAVSGKIDKPLTRNGTVHATLQVTTAAGPIGDLTVEWPEGIADSNAVIRGTLRGIPVLARTPAP
jgi:pimeloyl-ACP methyl ester carboxylesterase